MNLIKGSKNDNFKLVRHCYVVGLKSYAIARCIIRFLMLFMKQGFNFNYRAITDGEVKLLQFGHFL